MPTFFKDSQERLFNTVSIALVGKYTDLKDSYMSVTKALEHSAFRVHRKLTIHVRDTRFLVNFLFLTFHSGWNPPISSQRHKKATPLATTMPGAPSWVREAS